MTPDPVTVAPDASVMQAIQLMLKHRIGSLPVVDGDGTLVGIVTESDLLRQEPRIAGRARWLEFLIGSGKLSENYGQACRRRISEIMSSQVFTATDDANAAEVIDIMEAHRIRSVPIMRGRKLAGIVGRSDLVRALGQLLGIKQMIAMDDASMRLHLQGELDRQNAAASSLINIVVLKGVIQLWGVITDEGHREAIGSAAWKTPGVRAVEDHLMLVQPTAFAALMS
jgi:CBS-domain-containing membrane protein